MLLLKTANTTCRRGKKKGKMVKVGASPALFIIPSILIMNKICTFFVKRGRTHLAKLLRLLADSFFSSDLICRQL